MNDVEIRHAHLFCGIGAGAKGFNAARPRVGNMVGRFRCLGGIDVDRQAIEDFGRLTGVPGTVLDLFDRSQYIAFHGREPGADWREAGTVISGSTTGQGAFAVADPRPNMSRAKGDNYLTGGHYGVVPWAQPSYAVSASACLDNGHWSVADPRPMPAPDDKLVCRIQSLDGTWHRPFTTLELAALQSLFDPEEWFSPEGGYFTLAGNSDQRWREGIGNAVPSAAATGIAEVMGETLLLAWAGETFQLSMKPIWVQPLAIAISVHQSQGAGT